MNVIILQNSSQIKSHPSQKQFQTWILLTLKCLKTSGCITVRLVDEPEIQVLNKRYRGKNKPTNILSFPMDKECAPLLGDLVICTPLVKHEAKAQKKKIVDHFAHLTIHGVLHLLGHDHEQAQEAAVMEALEIKLLAHLSIGNPYE
jgi:probable rRNA maturation factor